MKIKLRRMMAYFLTLPFLAYYRLKPGEFKQISQAISLIPFPIGKKIRYEFYRRTLKSCGDDVDFHFGTVLNYPVVSIGNRVSLGSYNRLGMVNFGNDILTAGSCVFLSGGNTHNFDRTDVPISEQGSSRKFITVGDGTWFGTGSIVMESVGEGCVIGAGSVVTKEIAPNSIAVGNPARVIRKRDGSTPPPSGKEV